LPAIKGAYGSSDFGDDLSISALTLALATNQSSYYQDAYQFYQQFALNGTRDPWNWDSQKPALYVLFVETALTRPSLAQGAGLDTNLTGWRTEAENYFDRIINGNLPEVYITKGELIRISDSCDSVELI
jgi:endoglucanase